jgi:TolA-binding protein
VTKKVKKRKYDKLKKEYYRIESMSRRNTHIDINPGKSLKDTEKFMPESESKVTDDDAVLFLSISEHMRAHLDIEEVKNDPGYSSTCNKVDEMISDYRNKGKINGSNENFIKENFSSDTNGKPVLDEIRIIKQEIEEKNLNLVTAEWVREWHEKKQRGGSKSVKTDEIRNFVTDALKADAGEIPVKPAKAQRGVTRNLFIRYISLSAAALIGLFLLIRTLIPSAGSEKLFSGYYKPFEAVSPVTRGVNTDLSYMYSSAISSYRKGDYAAAVNVLDKLIEKDPASAQAKYYLGISQLALGNCETSISLLSQVASDAGEYNKEARWYLGLSYLKSGNREKAAECFETLARSDGYYHDRSARLLRRLK